jgi:hypothetical protein
LIDENLFDGSQRYSRLAWKICQITVIYPENSVENSKNRQFSRVSEICKNIAPRIPFSQNNIDCIKEKEAYLGFVRTQSCIHSQVMKDRPKEEPGL